MRTRISMSLAVAGMAVAAGSGLALAQTGPTDPYLGMEGRIFDAGNNFMMPYRLARPPNYNPATKYPLVVFLHGSGESGTDNRLQISKNIGVVGGGSVFTQPQNQAKYPTFFIAPQIPNPAIAWEAGSPGSQAVPPLIAELEAEFSIDPTRVYLTGLSIGGDGTWILIEEHPTMFGAAIPMSGGGDVTQAVKIAQMAIWDFHGSADPAKPVSLSRTMIAALEAAGGHPRYTEYPGLGHDIWTIAYQTPDLIPWMNAQRAGVADPIPPDASVAAYLAAEAADASAHDATVPGADGATGADAGLGASGSGAMAGSSGAGTGSGVGTGTGTGTGTSAGAGASTGASTGAGTTGTGSGTVGGVSGSMASGGGTAGGGGGTGGGGGCAVGVRPSPFASATSSFVAFMILARRGRRGRANRVRRARV